MNVIAQSYLKHVRRGCMIFVLPYCMFSQKAMILSYTLEIHMLERLFFP